MVFASQRVIFDPSYTGFHLPTKDFATLGTKLNSLFNRYIDRTEGEVVCEPLDTYCYLYASCAYVRTNVKFPFYISFDLTDLSAGNFKIELTEDELLIPD